LNGDMYIYYNLTIGRDNAKNTADQVNAAGI
jgi:hypothetical protein